jgi:hypothetical protein
VCMLFDPMESFARLFLRINMNDHEGKVFKVVKQLMPDPFGNRIGG